MKPLAFIDVETTGLDPERDEIIEIGVIRVDPKTLAEIGHTNLKVKPRRINFADPEALRINGYSPEKWKDAVSLEQALFEIEPLLEGATLAGHNVSFDKSFIAASWRCLDIKAPKMDYHIVDTAVLAWPLYRAGLIASVSLNPVCSYFGIERNNPHRAIDDAYCSLKVARRLLPPAQLRLGSTSLRKMSRPLSKPFSRGYATVEAPTDLGESMTGATIHQKCLKKSLMLSTTAPLSSFVWDSSTQLAMSSKKGHRDDRPEIKTQRRRV